MLSIYFKFILNVALVLGYNPIAIHSVNIDTIPSEVPEEIIEELEINTQEKILEVPEEIVEELEVKTSRKLKTDNPDCFLVEQNSKYGIECTENKGLPINYGISRNISNKYFVLTKSSSQGFYNVMKNEWIQEISPCILTIIDESYLVVEIQDTFTLKGLDGEIIIPASTNPIKYLYFNDYVTVEKDVKNDKRVGLFSASKKSYILKPKYLDISSVHHSDFIIVKRKNGFKLYNTLTNKWGKGEYQNMINCERSKTARVIIEKNKAFGLIDIDEKLLIPPVYQSIEEFVLVHEKFLVATSNTGKMDVYSYDGIKFLSDIDEIEKVFYDKLKFKKDGKYGFALAISDTLEVVVKNICDEISFKYGKMIVQKGERFNIFCMSQMDYNEEFPYDKAEVLSNKIPVVTKDGYIFSLNSVNCLPDKPTEFTSCEGIDNLYYGKSVYRYIKAKKGDSPYYLTNSKLELESQYTFTDIFKSKQALIFFKNENDKIGVYNALSDKFIVEAIYDSIEFYGQEIFLYKDGKKGKFVHDTVIME